MKIDKYISNNLKDLNNKKVIVTGANSGIGFSLAKLLISLSNEVVFACRNKDRAIKAMEEILKEYPSAKMSYVYFDQSNYETCLKSIKELESTNNLDFDAIIFNAGILSPSDNNLNTDGLPITIAVNYINVVFIVERLSKLINKEKEIRFIFQSSLTSRMVNKKKVNIFNNKISKMKQYGVSKYLLSNYKNYKVKYNNSNIKYLICEPGITNSNVIRNLPKFIQVLGHWFLKLFMLDTSKAALNGLMCALKNDLNDGDEYRPGSMFSITGYPKLIKTNKNNIKVDEDLINKTMEIINA